MFAALKPFEPRKFIPAQIDLGDWARIEPLLDRLEAELKKVGSLEQLKAWLLTSSEFSAAIAQESSMRYIAMTCQTDDPEREKAFLHFVENIEPKLKPRSFRLEQLLVENPFFENLDKTEYGVFKRKVRTHVELFRPENVPLETEETKLGQQYQKLVGTMTAQYDGREQTLPQLARYLEEPARNIRHEVFELMVRRRVQDREALDRIFDELLKLRVQIAQNAGFDNYRDYVFRRYERFDYTPADCEAFQKAVEVFIVPLARRIQEDRKRELGLDVLRPWDLSVDPKNRPPLRPFRESGELISKTQNVFDRLDPHLAANFRLMSTQDLLDLTNRKGKAPGGYQSTLQEARVPFIFMNAVGLHRDVETLLHESGHAFHSLAARELALNDYRHAPIEFCEVASMSMELLAADHLDQFYSPEDKRRAQLGHLKDIVGLFSWIAQIDAFQHWIYLNPGHTRKERTRAWLELTQRFGGIEDWSGYEFCRETLWHKQLHVFEVPFYYIEYGIAQLGALQIWQNARRDLNKTLGQYRHALSLGGSRPLPELFQAAGIRFDFSEATIRPLIEAVRKEYERLSQES